MSSQPREMYMSIGAENFRNLREQQGYYVDKTGLIAEYLEKKEAVTLVTRPRRFGKTLNMSMMAEVLCVGLGHCGKRAEIAWEVRKEICCGTKDV